MITYSTQVRRCLAANEITPARVAVALSMSPDAVRARLRGRTAWKGSELALIASEFGIPAAELLPEEVSA